MVIAKPALEQRFDRIRKPFRKFLRTQTLSSGLLLSGLVAALVMVNAGWQETYRGIQSLPLGFRCGKWEIAGSLLGWVNDGLIVVFFFLIGLEIKREFLVGELRQKERRLLLLAAALGGMVLPAAIYLGVNSASPIGVIRGWGIPMATDTALAIGVLATLRHRTPRSLASFLVGLAIVDDIGAVLVITVFYTTSLSWFALGVAASAMAALIVVNRAGFGHPLWYFSGAVTLWISLHEGGIHASTAGVLAALTVPARPRVKSRRLARSARRVYRRLRGDKRDRDVLADGARHAQIRAVERAARNATTPLRRWEDSLALPVALLILPAFAFLNGGIHIDGDVLRRVWVDPVALGIVLGLVVGKPAGILGAAWVAVRTGIAVLPDAIRWRHICGLGLVAGIGFTMSTFIGNLAFAGSDHDIGLAKLAILEGSLLAGALGFVVLWRSSPRRTPPHRRPDEEEQKGPEHAGVESPLPLAHPSDPRP